MKNLVFVAMILFVGGSLLGNNRIKIENSYIDKVIIGDVEILGLEDGKYLFKRYNTNDGGFSFFSPFYEYPDLIQAQVKTLTNN